LGIGSKRDANHKGFCGFFKIYRLINRHIAFKPLLLFMGLMARN